MINSVYSNFPNEDVFQIHFASPHCNKFGLHVNYPNLLATHRSGLSMYVIFNLRLSVSTTFMISPLF